MNGRLNEGSEILKFNSVFIYFSLEIQEIISSARDIIWYSGDEAEKQKMF